MQVRWAGMGIICTETSKEYFFNICFVISIRVFQEKHVWRLRNDESAIGKSHTCWNAESFCKPGKLICLAIFIGILTDQDIIAATFWLAFIGIIFCDQHIHPSFFIPADGDGVHHIGLCSEKLQVEIYWHLDVFHGLFRRQWHLL